MGSRHEQRTNVSLSVRVTGIDCDGNPFAQTAKVVEISRTGARLEELRCLREPGDVIEIEHNHATAKFKIEWIGIPGTAQDGQAGVSLAESQKNFWRQDPGPLVADTYVAPAVRPDPFAAAAVKPAPQSSPWTGKERRRSSRVEYSATARLEVEGANFPIWTELSDISIGGCYVKMSVPVAKGSPLELTTTIENKELTTKGRVVTVDPGVGIGISFDLDPSEMLDLWRVLRKLGSKIQSAE